jgi:DNA-binding response OmpR family regulator
LSTTRKRILLVEDEPGIASQLERLLVTEGYAVAVAFDAAAARAATATATTAPDLVILDWMLPDGQGIDLLRAWRGAGRQWPVIFLTARDELIDKVLGLELGADDYMTKPFEPRELLARIKARLRAPAPAGAAEARRVVAAAGIEIDDETRVVTYLGRAVELTKMEYALLHLLVESPNKVFSRDELLDKVWGFESYPTTRTVDTHVLQLRQKLAPELVETVRGVGYRLRAKDLTES